VNERHQTGLLRAVKACLIHTTLLGEPEIEVAVNRPAGTIGSGAGIIGEAA
jgi:hypothetical protein